jgi:hypothetical protein
MTASAPASHTLSNRVLWWLCLFLAPLALVGIELFHPAGFTHDPGMFAYLSTPQPAEPQHRALGYFGPQWWFWLHMIQTPLVGLVCIGLWLMLKPVTRDQGAPAATAAWLARIVVFVMLIYFTALDAIGGFGLARYIVVAQQFAGLPADAANHLSAEQLKGVVMLLNAMWVDPWVGGQLSFVSQTASWASFIAAVLVAAALFLARKAPVAPLLLFVAFGWILQLSHTALHGPIAFGLLAVAALWIRLRPGPGLI